jgi:hypothetical protein
MKQASEIVKQLYEAHCAQCVYAVHEVEGSYIRKCTTISHQGKRDRTDPQTQQWLDA